MYLFILNRFIVYLCPAVFNYMVIVGFINMIATLLFIILSFVYSPVWWYSIAIYFGVLFVTPKINPDELSDKYRIVSSFVNLLQPIIILIMYLSLFDVI